METQRVCYTIHNFKHQGVAGADILWATGLNRPEYYYDYSRLRDNFNPNAINLMKAGIVYSNYVNTVSPHHAWEARHTPVGCGLQHTLELHQHKYGGILNGLNYDVWNPEKDSYVPYHYSVDNFEDKVLNKKALREQLGLRQVDRPLVCYIGRLDQQKGVQLVHHAIYYSLQRSAQFVLLGSATESSINSWFWHEKQHLDDNPDCHIELSFNEELAHLMYAAADIVLVPSNYEPCGLTQLIGLRYGAVPVVRGVGGLLNTVFDWDYDMNRRPEERNGFVFFEVDNNAIDFTLGRAFDLWYLNRPLFEQLAKQGMNYDYSWSRSGDQYIGVYSHIRHK
jgi:starch synthase